MLGCCEIRVGGSSSSDCHSPSRTQGNTWSWQPAAGRPRCHSAPLQPLAQQRLGHPGLFKCTEVHLLLGCTESAQADESSPVEEHVTPAAVLNMDRAPHEALRPLRMCFWQMLACFGASGEAVLHPCVRPSPGHSLLSSSS